MQANLIIYLRVCDSKVYWRNTSGCMFTVVSVSACCGNPAPVLFPFSGTTTARIWWIKTFKETVVMEGVLQPCIYCEVFFLTIVTIHRIIVYIYTRMLRSPCCGSECLAWALCTRRHWLCWIRLATAALRLTSTLQDTPSCAVQPAPSTSSCACWPCASPRMGLGEPHRDRSKGGKAG